MKYTVDICGNAIELELVHEGDRTWAIIRDRKLPVELHRHPQSQLHTLSYGNRHWTLWLAGQGRGYTVQWQGRAYQVELEPAAIRDLRRQLKPRSAAKAGEEMVTAYMSGLIVKVEVKEGQIVRKGDGLLVIDAMKMQNEIRAPCDGVIAKIAVEAGREVSRGQLLCMIRTK